MSKIIDKKAIILALETSGRTGSAALAAGDMLICEKQFSTPVKHSSEVFPAIQELLRDASLKPQDLEQICISAGPGSFTGLRIAVTIAKIMQLANERIKIVAVDTLDCVASNIMEAQMVRRCSPQQGHRGTKEQRNKGTGEINRVASVLDAKRGQFFIAVYKRKQDCKNVSEFYDCWEKTIDDCLMTAGEFTERYANPDEPVWLLGEGLVYYKKDFEAKWIEYADEQFWTPKASKVFALGRSLAKDGHFADAIKLVPKYILRPDIKIKSR